MHNFLLVSALILRDLFPLFFFSVQHPDNEEGVMSVSDTLVLVEMGELMQGVIDKKTVGNAQNSLIHLIWVEYGPFRCAQFFTEVQKMVNHWLINAGFSIGIGDAVATPAVLGPARPPHKPPAQKSHQQEAHDLAARSMLRAHETRIVRNWNENTR
jgi:hypothetical protein